jgi:GDPmannose 4,6-dehydratase
MLQQDSPDDYIIATGESYSVRDFLNEAFTLMGLDWGKYVKIDKSQLRPLSDKAVFLGDSSKAKKVLGWSPKVSFKELVKIMIEEDLRQKGVYL